MKTLLFLSCMMLGMCSTMRFAGRIEYTGQHGTYGVSSDGKTLTGIIRLNDRYSK